MGQGLVLSGAPLTRSAGGFGAAAVAQHSSGQDAIRQTADGAWLVGTARLDNRAELCTLLDGAVHPGAAFSDLDLVERAYLRWGERCVEHLRGDWALAIWQPAARRLFLARDQFGITSLYYAVEAGAVAFATLRKPLLAWERKLAAADDLYLAHLLLSWKVYNGGSTPHAAIRRLPPAHTLTVTADGAIVTHCYWRMMDAVSEQPPSTLAEAAAEARIHFDAAVRCRLRPGETVATSLSGGIDSSAVALTAAEMLQAGQDTLRGYTAVPLSAQNLDEGRWFGNEWQLASVAARQALNLSHFPVRSTATTPLDGIRESLWIHDGPVHAAGNAYWMHDLMRMAQADGCQVLLTGQTGNLGISWTGEDRSRPGPRALLRRILPASLRTAVKRRRLARAIAHGEDTAIHPDLARRTDVLTAQLDDPYHPLAAVKETALERRVRMLGAGRTIVGCLLAEHGHAFGLDIRDPTADIRLLTYCLSVPPHLFVDPQTGMDRMLMRAAMADRLPDEVRLNRRRGLQAADIIPRLRADRDAMEACLDELARGDAIHYVSLPRLRQVWQDVLARDDRATHIAAKAVLLRGIMAGLFVQNPAGGPRPDLERSLPAADREIG